MIVAGWQVQSTTFLFIAYSGRLYDLGFETVFGLYLSVTYGKVFKPIVTVVYTAFQRIQNSSIFYGTIMLQLNSLLPAVLVVILLSTLLLRW